MNAPGSSASPQLVTGAFMAALLAVFAVAVGSSVVLPVLPFVLERIDRPGAFLSPAWHVGVLTGLYLLAAFFFAPSWGRWSDRFGRRRVLLVGLAGQAATSLLFGLELSLPFAYIVRVLNGVFAAAVVPVLQAYIADESEGTRRGRRFAWLGTASLFGFLVGPMIGGMLSRTGEVWPLLAERPFSALLGVPAFAASLLALMAWLAAFVTLSPIAKQASASQSVDTSAALADAGLRSLFRAGFVIMFGIGAFEVAASLQVKDAMRLSAVEIGYMFMECSLVMIVAQLFAFSSWLQNASRRLILGAGLLVLASAVAAMPWAGSLTSMLVWVGVYAGASGLLSPLVTYWVSVQTRGPQGRALGRLSGLSSLGQAGGAILSGPAFGLSPYLPFLATAGLLLSGALAASVAKPPPPRHPISAAP